MAKSDVSVMIPIRSILFGGSIQKGRFVTPSSDQLKMLAAALATPTGAAKQGGDLDNDDDSALNYSGMSAGWKATYPAEVCPITEQQIGDPKVLIEEHMAWRRTQWESVKAGNSPHAIKAFEDAYCVTDEATGTKELFVPKVNKSTYVMISGNTRGSQMHNAGALAYSKGMSFSYDVPCVVSDIKTEDDFIRFAMKNNTDDSVRVRLSFIDYVGAALYCLRKGWTAAEYRKFINVEGSITNRTWATAYVIHFVGMDKRVMELLLTPASSGASVQRLTPGDFYDDPTHWGSVTNVHRAISASAMEKYVRTAKEKKRDVPECLKKYEKQLELIQSWSKASGTPCPRYSDVAMDKDDVMAWLQKLIDARAAGKKLPEYEASSKDEPITTPGIALASFEASPCDILKELSDGARNSDATDVHMLLQDSENAISFNALLSIVRQLESQPDARVALGQILTTIQQNVAELGENGESYLLDLEQIVQGYVHVVKPTEENVATAS